MSEPRPPSHLSLENKFGRRVSEQPLEKADAKATAVAPRSPEATMAILSAMMGENNIAPHHGKPKGMSLAKTWQRGVVSLLVVAGMSATFSMAMVKADFHVKSFVNLNPQTAETINEYFGSSGVPLTSVDSAGTIHSAAPANLSQPVYPGDRPGVSTRHPEGEMPASAPASDGRVAMPFDTANPIDKAAINHHLAAARLFVKPHTVPAWAQYMKPSDAAQLESDLKSTASKLTGTINPSKFAFR